MLTEEMFKQRAPNCGDILYSILKKSLNNNKSEIETNNKKEVKEEQEKEEEEEEKGQQIITKGTIFIVYLFILFSYYC
jgi:hypothetical protein